MTKITGKHAFKSSPSDAEAWNGEVAALRARVVKKHGEGVFEVRPQHDFGGSALWSFRPKGRSGRRPRSHPSD